MSELITRKCDACGAIKVKANNWFRALFRRGHYILITPADDPVYSTFQETALFLEAKHHDYCSESCVAKAMSQAIGSQKAPSADLSPEEEK